MNIAIIKHIGEGAPNKEYLFCVPTDAKVQKGTLVKVKTRYGESYGVLMRDSFEADGDALEYIKTSLGVAKNGELQPIIAAYGEIPVCESAKTVDDVRNALTTMRDSKNNYAVSYNSFPIKFRARRKDNAEMMESPCVYTTSDGKMYLGTTGAATEVTLGGNSGNIYEMSWAADKALFVEIEPCTLEWTVEK